jgi:hypothetical protein
MRRTLKVLWVLLVDDICQVPSIVKDHIKMLAAGKSSKGLLNAPVIFFLCLTLPCKNGNSGRSNTSGLSDSVKRTLGYYLRSSSMVLCRENILDDKYSNSDNYQ